MTKEDTIILQVHDKKTHELEFMTLRNIKDLNFAIDNGLARDVINMSEILMDQRINKIADDISDRGTARVMLIAGPSSSGKTTFSKRMTLHLMANGMKPYPISLDDYFVDRTRTPIDENGEYDYESVHALDLELLNKHIIQLLAGHEIELPRYDFPTGTSQKSGKRLRLDDDMVLIFEGIHGLNPLLTSQIPNEQKFKIYAAPIAPIHIDKDNMVSSTDSRLIRRILRDNKYRGTSAQSTIARWPSVRRGEEKWVFPFRQFADAEFNSVQFYELAIFRDKVIPILDEITPEMPEYEVAQRLKSTLQLFHSITDYSHIPSVSLLREFTGGSSFRY